MKKLSALLLLPFLLLPTAALADHRHGGSARGRVCYKEVWREEYVPGNRYRRGYVRRWQETKEIPCRRRRRHHHHHDRALKKTGRKPPPGLDQLLQPERNVTYVDTGTTSQPDGLQNLI